MGIGLGLKFHIVDATHALFLTNDLSIYLTLIYFLWIADRSQVGCGPTANYLFCFAKKGNPKKATVDSPLRGAYATLQHNLCITKNGKVLKLAFGSNNNTFLSIFCEAQITSSQTGVGQSQNQSQSQKQRPTTAIRKMNDRRY